MDKSEKLNGTIDRIVLQWLIEHGLERDSLPQDLRDKLIEPALKRLGFSYEQPPDLTFAALREDFLTYFQIELSLSGSRRMIGDWRSGSLSSAQLSPGADRTLTGWACANPDELTIIAGPRQYDEGGHVDPPQTRLRDGGTIHAGRSFFFCAYRGSKMLVSLVDQDVQVNGVPMWYWQTAVRWAECPREASLFIEGLNSRIEGQLVSERRGKVLSSTYRPISLRTYQLEELAFPAPIRQDVEELVTAFEQWQSPKCAVPHWGAALVGKPGTGKTTIAGVLAGRKQPNCTVLYCPAHDFVNLPRSQNVQDIVRDVFSWTRRLAPVLLIVDDLDMIVPARGGGYFDPVTSCFMENLDSLSSTTKLFLVVTTNRPEVVESAILDRPGRVGTRIRFEGFDTCFGELLQSQAKLHGLSWDDAGLSEFGENEPYRALMASMEVTPDIAKNVMQRVALSKKRSLSRDALEKALQATTRSFGNTATASTT